MESSREALEALVARICLPNEGMQEGVVSYRRLRRALGALIVDAPQRNQWYLQLSEGELTKLMEELKVAFRDLGAALLETAGQNGPVGDNQDVDDEETARAKTDVSTAAREVLFMLIARYSSLVQTDAGLGDSLVECVLPCYSFPMFAVALSQCPPSESSMYNTLKDPSVANRRSALAWSLPRDVTRNTIAENAVRAAGKDAIVKFLSAAMPDQILRDAPRANVGFYAAMAIEAIAAASEMPDVQDVAARTLIARLKSLSRAAKAGEVSLDSVAAAQAIACAVCATARLEDEPLADIFRHIVTLALDVDLFSCLECLAAIVKLQHAQGRPAEAQVMLERTLACLCVPASCEDLMGWWINNVAGEENENRHEIGSLLLAGIMRAAYIDAGDGSDDKGIQVAADHFLGEMALAEALSAHVPTIMRIGASIFDAAKCNDDLSAFIATIGNVYPAEIDSELRTKRYSEDVMGSLRGSVADYASAEGTVTLIQACTNFSEEPMASLEALEIICQRHGDALRRGASPLSRSSDDDEDDKDMDEDEDEDWGANTHDLVMKLVLSVLSQCPHRPQLWACVEHIGFTLQSGSLEDDRLESVVDALSMALHRWMDAHRSLEATSSSNSDDDDLVERDDVASCIKAALWMLTEVVAKCGDTLVIERALVAILAHCPIPGEDTNVSGAEALSSLRAFSGKHPLLCEGCIPVHGTENGDQEGAIDLARSVALALHASNAERFDGIIDFLERTISHVSRDYLDSDEGAKRRAVNVSAFLACTVLAGFDAIDPMEFSSMTGNSDKQKELAWMAARFILSGPVWSGTCSRLLADPAGARAHSSRACAI